MFKKVPASHVTRNGARNSGKKRASPSITNFFMKFFSICGSDPYLGAIKSDSMILPVSGITLPT